MSIPDWEAIESVDRSGLMPVREIALQYSIKIQGADAEAELVALKEKYL